jgi:hypothetical protein
MPTRHAKGLRRAALVLGLACLAGPVAAQSLTSGSLRGVVRDAASGSSLRGVSLTLEGRSGGAITTLQTGFDGEFRLGLLRPGEYRLLAEQQGFQPIRLTGIVVAAGEATVLEVTLERRPPPIEAVRDVPHAGARVGTASGRLVGARELAVMDWRREASDALRGVSEAVWPTDGRAGFGVAAAGLPPAHSRLIVDGVSETPIRHLGLPAEPVPWAAWVRDDFTQLRPMQAPLDAEWRSTLGTTFAGRTRTGTDRVQFTPFANVSSAALGGRAADNPFDSTATSIQAGAMVSGALVPDTAHFVLRADWRSLELPTAFPWEADTARYRGSVVSLRETLPSIGRDSFATALGPHVGPAVRTWKGATGMGKLDWLLSPTNRLAARFSFASWKERTPFLGDGLSLAAGSELDARDISAALGLTTSGATVANELRAGFSTSRRDFGAAPVAATALVADGVAFGGSAVLPAFFDARTVDLSNAFQLSRGDHQIKVGASVSSTAWQYDYRYGGAGVFRFADLDRFGQARGTWYRASSNEIARFNGTDVGLFLQDTWHAAPDLQLVVGLRYEISPVPKNRISQNAAWLQATGVRNDSLVTRYNSVAPRIGFVWDARGEWVLRGGVGLHYGRLDPAAFGEAMLYDGGVTVRRGAGVFASWPNEPDAVLAPVVGPALTILNPTLRPPRALKAEAGLTRSLRGGVNLHVTALYQHTDFLLRRQDLNLVGQAGTTQEGRPVFGRLVQQGGFVSPQIGSNRRFADFDMVSGLSPVGYSDHYEVTTAVERVAGPLSLAASYTFSQTRDNLVGARSLDPADQLSPFPGGLDGVDWDRGRSDFDVPHRFAATLEYRSPGSGQLALAGRYRVRSGLPFTPGFRPGVDPNADGSGGNDPAFLGGGIPGLAEALTAGGCAAALGNRFAERNSCREQLQQGLDLHLSVGLPVGGAGARVRLELDAFNVVATETGVLDRAAVLINPAGTVVTDGAGNVTLPLIANPRFGSLLARRGEPRVVRVGLRMEY